LACAARGARARCGQTGRQLVIHDRCFKRWRHLDLGSTRCVIECELRLLRRPDGRIVRVEPVPWPGREPITPAPHRHQPFPMKFTHNSTGALEFWHDKTSLLPADPNCQVFIKPK
jgi:hypothetical protein